MLRTWLVTEGFFRVMGTSAVLGRVFLPEEYGGSGASPASVRTLIFARGARMAALGVAGGALLGIAATRLLRGMLYGVAPLDAVVFGATIVLVLLSGLLACSFAAWRAARADPIETLRNG